MSDLDDNAAVSVTGLRKTYDDLVAVDSIDFEVQPGEIFAFLGPNGAGKSTTIRMLCTLTRPTSGSARVAGFDVVQNPNKVRRSIGLVFQEPTVDNQLTAEENLRFHAVLYGVPSSEVDSRIDHVLSFVGLNERRKDLLRTFSGGMSRRLEIARSLLHTPRVLFLDEPTVGLDPQTRAALWADVIRMRNEEHITVFLTTHYMDEAEYADRIAIIDHGKIVALDTPLALKAAVGADTVTLSTENDENALANLVAAGRDANKVERGVLVKVAEGTKSVAALIGEANEPVRNVQVHQPTLDDVFMHYTGREIRDAPANDKRSAAVFARMARRA